MKPFLWFPCEIGLKVKMVLLLTAALCKPEPAAAVIPEAHPAIRPNVVVLLADDQGWGDLSFNGNRNYQTPALDNLARAGVSFDHFYVCPVCSPTRAEFLTGRYHPRGGVRGVSTGAERLNLDEITIADAFKAAGYVTGAFGKWHNGTQYPYHPNGRGFDEFYGFCSGHWGTYFDPPLEHNGKPVRGRGYIADDFTDHALRFIEQHRARPFFCYLAFNTPHSPMQVPDSFYDRLAGVPLPSRASNRAQEDPAFTRAALAMCANLDWNVGRLLERLTRLDLATNTLVVYFSDNGPNSWRWNGGMKGRKGSTDEGGVRSPLFMRWPGRLPADARIPQIAAVTDLFPTLADLAGVPLPASKPLDGRSLKPLLGLSQADWPERLLFSHWNGRVSVRSQRYRLDADGRLFDIENDPGQQRDLAPSLPEVRDRLARAKADWQRELLGPLGEDDRPFTVGYRQFPATPLPARDGVPQGGIRRSASAPNCSFFENWTRTDDRITWDIEVVAAGRYSVVIDYTCPESEVGSRIELTFQSSRLEGRVTEAHDPPLKGAEHDRVPRHGESYVKDFRPFRLGSIELPRGRGPLTLRALSIPNKTVMDLRTLWLTLED
jgi:arylsulfatase A-like enzyme